MADDAPAPPRTAGHARAAENLHGGVRVGTGRIPAPKWWARRTLRTRLTAATTVVLAVGMALAAVALVWRLHASLMSGLDAAASQQTQIVATDLAAHGATGLRLPDADTESGTPIVQVVDADGSVVAASAGLDGNPRLFRQAGDGDPVLYTATVAPDSDDPPATFRLAAMTVDANHRHYTVYAALSTAAVEHSITELSLALAVGVPLIVALLGLLTWLLVGRALRPVEAMRRQVAEIPPTDLNQRLDVSDTHDELGRLAATFNGLLARIDDAVRRQRGFVADAAHELRSPIASLRAQLDVTQRHPDLLAASTRTQGLIADTDRLSHLVDDLLALARMDAHPHHPDQTVDLDDLVLAEARRVRDRGPQIRTAGVGAGRITGDPAALVRVVRNLLDNAVRHAATAVDIGLTTTGRVVTLTVADDGPGIAPQDRQRVFERFTRLDEARTRDQGGAGLGLAIVHDVVTNHNGTVTIEDNAPGARFIVRLPAAEA